MSNPQSGNNYFVATTSDRKSPRFHRPWCNWVPAGLDSALREGKWIEFTSHGQAIAAGYKACTTCSP